MIVALRLFLEQKPEDPDNETGADDSEHDARYPAAGDPYKAAEPAAERAAEYAEYCVHKEAVFAFHQFSRDPADKSADEDRNENLPQSHNKISFHRPYMIIGFHRYHSITLIIRMQAFFALYKDKPSLLAYCCKKPPVTVNQHCNRRMH